MAHYYLLDYLLVHHSSHNQTLFPFFRISGKTGFTSIVVVVLKIFVGDGLVIDRHNMTINFFK
jgi:hypothetical protein